ncbi:hypothetical protein HWV62_39293 [Athelia sp. TMB]|nr:hypothetical protein HWV62_39293 [Athelia sp. TMB]
MKAIQELQSWGQILDWYSLERCFNENPYVEPMENEAINVARELIACREYDFSFDGTPDPALIGEVERWWQGAIPDEDIRQQCNINIADLARMVARSGAAPHDLSSLLESSRQAQGKNGSLNRCVEVILQGLSYLYTPLMHSGSQTFTSLTSNYIGTPPASQMALISPPHAGLRSPPMLIASGSYGMKKIAME